MNLIDGTKFSDENGSVEMTGMGQTGGISVTGNAIGFQAGGALIFGAYPETVEGNCPVCNHHIKIEKHKLMGYTAIKCPNCGKVLPYTIV